ncbi:MAG: transposase [Chloroflexi bacterium]|nr:MAG: transposase [Chloroflexota bacterium]
MPRCGRYATRLRWFVQPGTVPAERGSPVGPPVHLPQPDGRPSEDWGGHGLCLWCQRLEAGRYHFPEAPADAASVELTAGQFQMVLDGIDLSRVRRFKRLGRP